MPIRQHSQHAQRNQILPTDVLLVFKRAQYLSYILVSGQISPRIRNPHGGGQLVRIAYLGTKPPGCG